MGFTVMESFMDTLELFRRQSGGVEVRMTKKLKGEKYVWKKYNNKNRRNEM